jgi:hypothetical protein
LCCDDDEVDLIVVCVLAFHWLPLVVVVVVMQWQWQ